MNASSAPEFAVVGHPNKGKSSLVATLARDLKVRIGPDPGTTREARRFPMRVEGELLYTLTDTPGFQRARAALAWMKAHEKGASSRPAVVASFVAEHRGGDTFRDECELLSPLVEGAGIIYVVDGASPYGPEYEAEMEILRWSGRPSMAIINPIGQPRYVDEWSNALGQFFRVVRVVDVLRAPFGAQIELLRAFGQLSDSWRNSLNRAVEALLAHRRRQREDSARIIAELLGRGLTYQEIRDLPPDAQPEAHTADLEGRFRGRLRQLERQARTEVESIYGYEGLVRSEVDIEWLQQDLLSEETWLIFGLRQKDLVVVGAVGGAAAGAAVDASLLGASLLGGTVVGGLLGGTLGYFSTRKLAKAKVLHLPLGGKRIACGPVMDIQFPFVLLGRAWLHHRLVVSRTHAQRDPLNLDDPSASAQLADGEKRTLSRIFTRLRKSDPGSGRYRDSVDELSRFLVQLFEQDAQTDDGIL